jgi:hypothetical protein
VVCFERSIPSKLSGPSTPSSKLSVSEQYGSQASKPGGAIAGGRLARRGADLKADGGSTPKTAAPPDIRLPHAVKSSGCEQN